MAANNTGSLIPWTIRSQCLLVDDFRGLEILSADGGI